MMTDVTPPDGTPSHADDSGRDEPELSRWPRMASAIVGTLTVGIGIVAIFTTKENEIATTALLVIGASFLLLAVQGTPLIRFGTPSAVVELAQLKRRVRKVAERAESDEPSPDVARGLVEAAATIDPALARYPAVAAAIYENQVEAAIRRHTARWPSSALSRAGQDGPVDFTIRSDKQFIDVIVKFRRDGPLRLRDVRLDRVALPTLVLTNAPLSGEVQEHNSSSTGLIGDDAPYVEFVTWNDERDDGILIRSLSRVFAKTSPVG